ncbi:MULTISPECIES: hypothetical protein [unclassified Yoonia]|uniref:hypothetical protein n=1 Tax=unclassified Yoonia TaxID=2629118 RepID=UPI002AFEC2D3|nr:MULTISPECIES: hypothetical protein [unclassified Yoonia]
MIVGKDWIWLHFPKCGGTSAEALLRKNFGDDPEVKFDEIDYTNVIWHQNIIDRKTIDQEFSSEGKRIVCIFRRLPDWILSRVHYEFSRPPNLLATREMIECGQFFENSGMINSADKTFDYYNSPEVNTWLRLESLHTDFENFLGQALEPLDRSLNENKFNYVRKSEFWFTRNQLEDLYNANPNWSAAERLWYGDCLV